MNIKAAIKASSAPGGVEGAEYGGVKALAGLTFQNHILCWGFSVRQEFRGAATGGVGASQLGELALYHSWCVIEGRVHILEEQRSFRSTDYTPFSAIQGKPQGVQGWVGVQFEVEQQDDDSLCRQ